MGSILVVCVGNICRSPVGERMLARELAARGAQVRIASAGIGALVGHSADPMAAEVALSHGIALTGHVARQFSHTFGHEHDLILVMEPGHRGEINRLAPDLSGRVMLFDHWTGGRGIPDPFRQPRAVHEAVAGQIAAAAAAWADRLAPRKAEP